jgi:hypothetical protein
MRKNLTQSRKARKGKQKQDGFLGDPGVLGER